MKRKINKLAMMVVATVMFMGVMFLSFEKNDEGKWEFTTSALAQSGEGGDEEPPCAPGTEKGYSSWMTVAGPYVVRDPIHPMIWYECYDFEVTQDCNMSGNECVTCGAIFIASRCEEI